MNSGPIGVRTFSATMRSISAMAAASSVQPKTSLTAASVRERAPQSAIVLGARSSTQRSAK